MRGSRVRSLKSLLGSLFTGLEEGTEAAVSEGSLEAGVAEAAEETAEDATGVDVDIEE